MRLTADAGGGAAGLDAGMRPRAATGLLLLAGLGPTVPAHAATVSLRPGPVVDEQRLDIVEFAADPGEANDVTATVTRIGPDRQGSDTLVTLVDPGATLRVARGCAPVDAHTVRCRTEEVGELRIALADRDDRAAVRSVSADQFIYEARIDGGEGDDLLATNDGGYLSGGPGDDALIGSAAYDVLDGGPGDDRLAGGGYGDFMTGGSGDDVLFGGPGNDDLIGGDADEGGAQAGQDRLFGEAGNDTLDDGDDSTQPASIGPDLIDGGTGTDSVDSYRHRTTGVLVDLRSPAPNGQPGESDTLRSIETVIGGAGPDVLIGDDGRNWLDGRDGRDLVAGRGGADRIFGWDRDAIAGDDGDDDLRVNPTFLGTVSCGRGLDTVRLDTFRPEIANRSGTLLDRACERLSSGTGFTIVPVGTLTSRGRVVFRVLRTRRNLTLALTEPAPPFGQIGAVPIAGGHPAIALDPAQTHRLRAPGALVRATAGPLGDAPFIWRFDPR